jgi:hypothetical protein
MHTSPSTQQPSNPKRTWTKPTLTNISLGDAEANKIFATSETTTGTFNGHLLGFGTQS